VLGDKESYAHGSISDGIFHGRIVTSQDSYFVEKARYYFPNHSYVEDGFHSVIYKDKHVEDPYKDVRTVHENGCGLTDDVSNWMDRIQNSVKDDDDDNEIVEIVSLEKKEGVNKNDDAKNIKNNNDNNNNNNNKSYVNKYDYDESIYPHKKYSKEANSRTKRATGRYQERNTCSLYIQTDPLIWRHIRESIPDVSYSIIVYLEINKIKYFVAQ
jgi:disintegrin and metalloproteinase domain-containing protein 10